MKVLIVEDDWQIAAILKQLLTEQRYIVEVASDGQEGLAFAEATTYDLIVLDVMLPKLDGIDLCRKLRLTEKQTLILMLTAKDSGQDKVEGLDVGADDYMTKPFDTPELLARIRALLRRRQTESKPVLAWEKLSLDVDRGEVHYDTIRVPLTAKEYSLVALFLQQGDRLLNYELILEQLWTFDDTPSKGAVKAHIRMIRQKLKQAGAPPNLIENVYGLGYRLNPNL